VNSPWENVSVVLPASQVADSTSISGMPGWLVKSAAMSRMGLPAAACTALHRSADTVLPYACFLMYARTPSRHASSPT
jgi:hypothetical protein